jgi:hypothetical protein
MGELETVLADRIADFARDGSLLKAFPGDIDWLILLLHWQHNRGSKELHAYYRRVVESDALESVALVRSQLGLSVPGSFTNDFQLGHYKNLALLADPEDVYRSIKAVSSSKITPQDAKLICQFEALHAQQDEA